MELESLKFKLEQLMEIYCSVKKMKLTTNLRNETKFKTAKARRRSVWVQFECGLDRISPVLFSGCVTYDASACVGVGTSELQAVLLIPY